MKKAIAAIYIIACLLCIFCVPLSAILVICKLCAVTSLSWLGCCVPLIIALSVLPFLIIAKIILDGNEK